MKPDEQIDKLCGASSPTGVEAKKLFRLASSKTGPGSGFDLNSEISPGLPAVCALLASIRLNNTQVTFEAAQTAASIDKPKFKRLQALVEKAIDFDASSIKRGALEYESLRFKFCSALSTRAVKWMKRIEDETDLEALDATSDEIKAVIFAWVCDTIQPNDPMDMPTLKAECNGNLRKLRSLKKAIQEQWSEKADDIKKDMASVLRPRGATASPQKRVLPGSPQKPSVPLDSPSKRQKTLATPLPSPTKSLPTRRPSPSPPRSPTKSPTKGKARATASSEEDETADDDEEELPPSRLRRFRPVFRDSIPWDQRYPQREEMLAEAKALGERMVKLYGRPFDDEWRAIEEGRDAGSDVDMG